MLGSSKYNTTLCLVSPNGLRSPERTAASSAAVANTSAITTSGRPPFPSPTAGRSLRRSPASAANSICSAMLEVPARIWSGPFSRCVRMLYGRRTSYLVKSPTAAAVQYTTPCASHSCPTRFSTCGGGRGREAPGGQAA